MNRDLLWDDRRKPGGARVIAYAGPRATSTRFGAGFLFVVSSLAFMWMTHKHVDGPPWIQVMLGVFVAFGVAVVAVSWPGSSRGRIEVSSSKLRFVGRDLFGADIELAARDVASFTSDTHPFRVYASMRSGVRIKIATFATLDAANEMVRELDALLASLGT